MKTKFWHKWPPALVLITEKGMRDPVTDLHGVVWHTAGQARGAVVRIRPAYAGDDGILMHELSHVRTFWWALLATVALALVVSGVCLVVLGPGFYLMLPWLACLAAMLLVQKLKPYKLWNEALAYAVQLKHTKGDGQPTELLDLAHRLAGPIYDFDLTVTEAQREILKYV